MRVLVTGTTFPRNSKDTEPAFVYFLSKMLLKQGHKVVVLVPHHAGAKKFEIMDGLKVYRFPYSPEKHQKLCYDGGIIPNLKKYRIAKFQVPLLVGAELYYMLKLIKKEKIDVVHAHWIVPQGFTAAIAKKLTGIPYIVTAHAGDVFPLKSGILKLFGKFSIQNSSWCTVNSNATKAAVMKVSNFQKISVIPMGVDLKDFSPKKRSAKLRKSLGINGHFLLSVGRLAEKKGLKYLLEAMPAILNRFPDAKLVIVGDGPEKQNLESQAKSLGISRSIVFTGKIHNSKLPEFYASCDVFVGPSIITRDGDTEGLGVVFLEAIASGAAAVGSNVGGIPDIIKDGKTGILVEQKNPEMLSSAIISLLNDPAKRQKLAKLGQEHISKNYSWDIVGSKFNDIFLRIGKNKSR